MDATTFVAARERVADGPPSRACSDAGNRSLDLGPSVFAPKSWSF